MIGISGVSSNYHLLRLARAHDKWQLNVACVCFYFRVCLVRLLSALNCSPLCVFQNRSKTITVSYISHMQYFFPRQFKLLFFCLDRVAFLPLWNCVSTTSEQTNKQHISDAQVYQWAMDARNSEIKNVAISFFGLDVSLFFLRSFCYCVTTLHCCCCNSVRRIWMHDV